MPKFAYAAIDSTGSVRRRCNQGRHDRRRPRRSDGSEPVPDQDRRRQRGALEFELTKEKVKKKELMHFTRQLAVFVKAGIPITEALQTIGDETEDVALRRTLTIDGRRPAQRWHALGSRRASTPRRSPIYYIGILAVRRAHRPARRDAGEPGRLPRA